MKLYASIGVDTYDLQGSLAAQALDNTISMDFGQEMKVGYIVYLRGPNLDGSAFQEEYVVVGSNVSGTTYYVTRGADSAFPPKSWPIGTRFKYGPNVQQLKTGMYGLDNIDVTNSVRFSTQLHGGFASCTFTVPGRRHRSFSRLTMYIGTKVIIYDHRGRSVWEGYVTNTSVSNRAGSLEVTASGFYSRAREVYFDMIYMSPDASTNLIPNPSFEVPSDYLYGWTLVNLSVSQGSYSEVSAYGQKYLALTQSAVSTGYLARNITGLTVGQDYVLSFYASGSGITGGEPVAKLVKGFDTDAVTLPLGDLDENMRRYELGVWKADTTSVMVMFVLPKADFGATGNIHIDAVQFEPKSTATAYFDGSYGGTCSWTGEAHKSFSVRTESPVYGNQVVKDCIDKMAQEGVPWNQNTSLAMAQDYDIGPCDFTGRKVADAIEYALSFGKNAGTTENRDIRGTYFAIYSDAMPYVITEVRPKDKWPNWLVSMNNTESTGMTINVDIASVYNRVYGIHSNSGNGPVVTEASNDYTSQARYGLREGIIQNGDLPYNEGLSRDLRNYALGKFKYPRPVYSIEITGMVYGANGYLDYPYMIRAGQAIVISDGDPMAANLGGMTGQIANRALGFILRTEYDAQTNTVRLDINSSDLAFEALMSRAGISGGLA